MGHDTSEQQSKDEQGDGAVSEVHNLGDGTDIEPDQSVAGGPDDDVQEGRQGPNARTGNESPR